VNPRINNYEGVVHTDDIRKLFEKVVADTSILKKVELEPVMKDGAFDGYKNDDTNVLWAGFAIGIRCAERIANSARGRKG